MRYDEHGGVVGNIQSEIVIRGVVPTAVEQLELAAPVVVPTSRNIILVEVVVVDEIGC